MRPKNEKKTSKRLNCSSSPCHNCTISFINHNQKELRRPLESYFYIDSMLLLICGWNFTFEATGLGFLLDLSILGRIWILRSILRNDFRAFQDKRWKALAQEMLFHSFSRLNAMRVDRTEFLVAYQEALICEASKASVGKPCFRISFPATYKRW